MSCLPYVSVSHSSSRCQVSEHQVQTLGALLGSKGGGGGGGGNGASSDEVDKLKEKIALLEAQLKNRDQELEVLIACTGRVGVAAHRCAVQQQVKAIATLRMASERALSKAASESRSSGLGELFVSPGVRRRTQQP